jgi:hypothetical protein
MSANDIYLGLAGAETLLSPFGRKFSRSPIEITREDRTASGRKVKDIVAIKYKFTLQYDLIDDADVRIFQHLYGLDSELSLKVTTPTGVSTYTVMLAPFSQERVTAVGSGLWSGVTIEMEQV